MFDCDQYQGLFGAFVKEARQIIVMLRPGFNVYIWRQIVATSFCFFFFEDKLLEAKIGGDGHFAACAKNMYAQGILSCRGASITANLALQYVHFLPAFAFGNGKGFF